MAATGKIATAGSVRERKLISVIVPVLNEQNNIARAYAEVCRVFEEIGRYDLEIIFTDNHSIDRTPEILADIARVSAHTAETTRPSDPLTSVSFDGGRRAKERHLTY